MSIRLPSRYEDLDVAFRGHLKPNQHLIDEVQAAFRSMKISGGVRFLPIYGTSGSGKSSAAIELATHLPELKVMLLDRPAIEDKQLLLEKVRDHFIQFSDTPLVIVIDQFEEVAAQQSRIPKEFVESVAMLDRGELRNNPVLFIWLTTDRRFQSDLINATTRNKRILASPNFEIEGPNKAEWPEIISETFTFHNAGDELADYQILQSDLERAALENASIGAAIEDVGSQIGSGTQGLQNLSNYQVVMLWPVTDATRISRIQQFTDARRGYKLDWGTWYRSLSDDEQRSVELRELNRARLYFDLRLVPIAAADLQAIHRGGGGPSRTALDRFAKTHFVSVVRDDWDSSAYSPLRERESKRADEAREWYATMTSEPTALGRSIAIALSALELKAHHEVALKSPHGAVRADVLATRNTGSRPEVIVELKAWAPENTMPSTISGAIKATLRRHAVFAGFIKR